MTDWKKITNLIDKLVDSTECPSSGVYKELLRLSKVDLVRIIGGLLGALHATQDILVAIERRGNVCLKNSKN